MEATDDGDPHPSDGADGAIEPTRSGSVEPIDPERLPVASVPTAAPSGAVRGLAFASIAIAGLCGGLIGFAFTDLQCDDGCPAAAGLGGVVGAVIGAVGVAIVAVLVLRAMDEWETVKARDAEADAKRRARGNGKS